MIVHVRRILPQTRQRACLRPRRFAQSLAFVGERLATLTHLHVDRARRVVFFGKGEAMERLENAVDGRSADHTAVVQPEGRGGQFRRRRGRPWTLDGRPELRLLQEDEIGLPQADHFWRLPPTEMQALVLAVRLRPLPPGVALGHLAATLRCNLQLQAATLRCNCSCRLAPKMARRKYAGAPARGRSTAQLCCAVLSLAVVPHVSRALEVDAAAAFYPASDMPAGRRDTLDWALQCLSSCKIACLEDPPARSAFEQALRWDDEEDCAYRCVHACLAEGVRAGGKLYKYRGRWPHRRLLGVQVKHPSGIYVVPPPKKNERQTDRPTDRPTD
jgi:hypothetical protein